MSQAQTGSIRQGLLVQHAELGLDWSVLLNAICEGPTAHDCKVEALSQDQRIRHLQQQSDLVGLPPPHPKAWAGR